jgi:hypothetical protein
MLDTAQDAFMATAYRTALIVALEEVFGTDLALAKYRQEERPSERAGQAVAEMVRNRELN